MLFKFKRFSFNLVLFFCFQIQWLIFCPLFEIIWIYDQIVIHLKNLFRKQTQLTVKTHLTINTLDNKMCKLHINVIFFNWCSVNSNSHLTKIFKWLKNLLIKLLKYLLRFLTCYSKYLDNIALICSLLYIFLKFLD